MSAFMLIVASFAKLKHVDSSSTLESGDQDRHENLTSAFALGFD